MELFKILKFSAPVSLLELFDMKYISSRMQFRLNLPSFNLMKSKRNFVYNGSVMWNNLISKILDKDAPGETGIILPLSSNTSDLRAPIAFVKKRLKSVLLKTESYDTVGEFDSCRSSEWNPENTYKFH